jgi:hypothetical protein
MAKDDTEATVKVTFNLPVSLVKAAKHWAVDSDQNLQDVVAAALVAFLKRKGGVK